MSIALRKTFTADEHEELTASVAKDSSQLTKYILKNQAYRFLHPVRGSPPYWQKVQLKLLAAVKQFGIFTWFFTLSAADLRWHDTIQEILAQRGTHLTNDDIDSMTWEQRCEVLRSNPITAARHFQFRLDMFLKDILMSQAEPVGKIRHYFYRIEFQQRGSPHAHGVLWIQNAPDIDKSSSLEITSFVDKYVKCNLPDENTDEELYTLVNQLQRHTHSPSCKKRAKNAGLVSQDQYLQKQFYLNLQT